MAQLVNTHDAEKFPATQPSADGTVTLHRFRVDGVIYAPTIAEAQARLEHSIEIDAGLLRLEA